MLAPLLLLAAALQPPTGSWRIERIERAPWAVGAPDRRLAGGTLTFLPEAVAGPAPFGCGGAEYLAGQQPADGLFQGVLGPGAATAARGLGIPDPATTITVRCDTGLFDFHRAGGRLVTALDNDIYWLRRVR